MPPICLRDEFIDMQTSIEPILHKKSFEKLTLDALGYAALLAKNYTNS